MNYKFFQLNNITANKGNLIVIENNKSQIPFVFNRLFYMFGCDNDNVRGKHSNKNSQFLFICLSGRCKVKIDDTFETQIFELDSKTKALWIDKLIWKEMYDFSEDAVLLVLSDCMYDPNEYIYDYEELKKIMRESKND